MTIKELIKTNLIDKNMTQKELAEILEVTEPAVTKWLKNESKPSELHLSKLCEALELDIYEVRSLLDFNHDEELAKKMFIDAFLNIDTVEKAANFIEELFIDFEMDPSDKVTMTYMLKCYAMITLLRSTNERHIYDDDESDAYDIEVFIAELKYGYQDFRRTGYSHYFDKYHHGETATDIERCIANLYITVFDTHYKKIEESGNLYRLEIYIQLLIEHIRKKAYTEYSFADKYGPF